MMHLQVSAKLRFARVLCALVALAAAAPSVRADVLALYPFTANSYASTDNDPLSTASAIALGSGLTDTTRFATAGNPGPALRVNADETTGTNFTTAAAASDFFLFNLTPASGYRFVFQNFTVDLATSATTFATNVEVQASINGGTSFINIDSVTAFSSTVFTPQTFDLSAYNGNAALQGGAPVLLRVVVYDNATGATSYTAFDNLTINGVVQAIPEPPAAALLGFGLILGGTVIVRRRKP